MALADWDWAAAIWEEADEAARKLRRGPKVHPELKRRDCRGRVKAQVASMVKANAGAEFVWLHQRCSRCGRCPVPPA